MRVPLLHSAAATAGRIVDRVLCVAGALLFSQAPEFFQQYLQRLEGHLDEARLQLGRLRDAAAQAGATLDQMAANAAANSDPTVRGLGGVVRETIDRVDRLGSADAALRGASAITRPFVFLAHFDPSIARATWAIFRPAVPTTAEGLAYAGAGMVAMLALFHGALKVWTGLRGGGKLKPHHA